VRYGARVVEVGKRGGGRSTPQVFIEKTMIEAAKAGHTVARLKGGDPFVFGRGGEELLALLEAGIEVEVIPGVTAGTAVPAMLGIPVTHRDLTPGVTFVTGHGRHVDWSALARSGTTLVIYMGLRSLPGIVAALLDAGMGPRTPACVIENGTLKSQRQLVGTLGTLRPDGFEGPALVVVGPVVGLARSVRQERRRAA
jgi:uroporphyrin-III C-methyltransferase